MVDAAQAAASLNADCRAAEVDRVALEAALRAQGEDFLRMVTLDRPHLFANAALFITDHQMEQMRAVVQAVEHVAALPGWQRALRDAPRSAHAAPRARGVFMGYDFHLNADGAHLIEINTNAGGAFLNDLLLQSQRAQTLPGRAAADDNLARAFLDMFQSEWRLERGDAALSTIAIVDEQPEHQYLYPEFLLAQRLFERAGIRTLIADPAAFELRVDGVYVGDSRIDLVYNRLTDFSLVSHVMLGAACEAGQVVVTPHPHAYALYADKRNLARLTDAAALQSMGVPEPTIVALAAGIPETRLVHAADHDDWWAERKHWFFKPATGYGGKGSYRGANLTRRVFEEIMRDGYVAQRLAPPGERMVCEAGVEAAPLKADVRCFVYDGAVQLVAARLYRGQTTNFRTPGGGFAPVRIIG